MRHVRYSNNVPQAIDWGAITRNLLIVLILFAIGWWLLNGPAIGWLESTSAWLRSL